MSSYLTHAAIQGSFFNPSFFSSGCSFLCTRPPHLQYLRFSYASCTFNSNREPRFSSSFLNDRRTPGCTFLDAHLHSLTLSYCGCKTQEWQFTRAIFAGTSRPATSPMSLSLVCSANPAIYGVSMHVAPLFHYSSALSHICNCNSADGQLSVPEMLATVLVVYARKLADYFPIAVLSHT
jgi:hypothetical protein